MVWSVVVTAVEDSTTDAPGAQRVRFYRNLFGSISDLKVSLREEKKKEVRWKRAFWAAFVAALLTSGLAIGAITSTSTTYQGASGEAMTYSEDFTVTSNGHLLEVLGASASTSAELTSVTYPTARTTITSGHWYYQVVVEEAAAPQLASGTFEAELFQDGTSLGILTITQNTNEELVVEGVVLQWSLNSGSLPGSAAYVVKISAV